MEVVVGRVSRAHGIRGELTVQVRTDEPERRFAPGSSLSGDDGPLEVAGSRRHSGRLLVRFVGIEDRTAAEALHGQLLRAEVDPAAVPEADDEFYDHQLVGLDVRRGTGERIGVVREVTHLPAQDLLAIDVDGREVLVPFVEALVPDVDLAAGTLTVADVPGLLDPDEAEEAP
ncbi:ribosome maturation factor RimM [Aeromicrobium sp. CTD01-1L150]|uniref:ribosome maturation factor RimM n=1 Tax=Aeromicrobium sp. CTD01-1L150 TaxID=3341830 RepID=UPI0035C0288F